jgi:hypothetical protein
MTPLLPPGFSAFIPDLLESHAEMVARAVIDLPMAAAVGAALAFRPRRSGTPPRSAPVIQTQIILSVIGAIVMLIVGSSLARAFGIAGAASLIRYRAAIDDPKDAVVALTTLTLGLATGVGLYGLVLFSTVFILALLWLVESLEPESRTTFELTVATDDPPALQSRLEEVLRRYRIDYELRSTGPAELVYETKLPMKIRTARVSDAIVRLTGKEDQEIRWVEATKKKK